MKKHKSKIAIGALGLAALMAAGLLLFPRRDALDWDTPEVLTPAEENVIREEISRIAELCREEYAAAEKLDGEYSGALPRLRQEDIDILEDKLVEAGLPTIDSDEIYPSYLANSEELREFAAYGEPGTSQRVIRISEDGGFWYTLFLCEDGEDCCVLLNIGWDEENEIFVRSCETLPLYEMELSDWGIVYYRLYPAEDPHYIDYQQIRMESVDRDMYDLYREYIRPVGYELVNLFLCDWQEGDWGEMSMTDVFEYLYEKDTGIRLRWEDYPCTFDPTQVWIPAELFENTLMPYFNISLEEFRDFCGYVEESDSYPWRPIFGDDLTIWKYPMCEAEVQAVAENSDGTLTLTVQVYSPELKTDRLFIHELTVRPLEDGEFQYVANRVAYVSDRGLPPNMARFQLDASG